MHFASGTIVSFTTFESYIYLGIRGSQRKTMRNCTSSQPWRSEIQTRQTESHPLKDANVRRAFRTCAGVAPWADERVTRPQPVDACILWPTRHIQTLSRQPECDRRGIPSYPLACHTGTDLGYFAAPRYPVQRDHLPSVAAGIEPPRSPSSRAVFSTWSGIDYNQLFLKTFSGLQTLLLTQLVVLHGSVQVLSNIEPRNW